MGLFYSRAVCKGHQWDSKWEFLVKISNREFYVYLDRLYAYEEWYEATPRQEGQAVKLFRKPWQGYRILGLVLF